MDLYGLFISSLAFYLHHVLFYISFGKTPRIVESHHLPKVTKGGERDGGGRPRMEGAVSNEGGEKKEEKTHMYLHVLSF